jgi:hypothetical protein
LAPCGHDLLQFGEGEVFQVDLILHRLKIK